MSTATLPMEWRGRSGRNYTPAGKGRVRHGTLSSVRKVVGMGEHAGTSVVDAGLPLALKQWREGDEASLDRLQQEARTLVELAARHQEQPDSELPCPRLYDLVGDPLVTGVITEWCPLDLERWWRDKLQQPEAFGRLCAVMAEAAKRINDYQRDFAGKGGLDIAHGDVKPTNVLMNSEGRWVVSDFGCAPVRAPSDDVWAESRVVVATDNFLAPEVLFHARRPHPAAVDTWSLAASLFALLKLRRMVLDGSALPHNGTASPRFRMERVARVMEVYGRDPQRFEDRDLDPEAFPDPLRIPDEDRQAVRDALRGVFGDAVDPDEAEGKLADEVVALLDRALSIDPAHRFTDARDISAAFEGLTRAFLALSAHVESPTRNMDPDELVAALENERVRNAVLRQRLGHLEAQLAAPMLAPQAPVARVPLWLTSLIVTTLGLQALTLIAVVLLWVVWATSGGPGVVVAGH